MKKILFVMPLILILGHHGSAQKYGTALGLRVGDGSYRTIGITAEQRLLKHITVEGILQSDFSRNTSIHGLMKNHIPLITRRLNLTSGAGVSFGNEESMVANSATKEVTTTFDNNTVGVDLMIGAELTLFGLSTSIDFKPNFNITGRDQFYMGQTAISIRKVLIKDSKRKRNKRQRTRAKRKKARQKENS